MKRAMTLSTPMDKGDGIMQSKVEINYVYVHDDNLTVYTKQGNAINVPMTETLQAAIEEIEDSLKSEMETPKVKDDK